MVKPKTIKSICVCILIITFIFSLFGSLVMWLISLQTIDKSSEFLFFKRFLSLLICFIFPLFTTFLVSICLYPLYALCNIDENISEINKKLDHFIMSDSQEINKDENLNNVDDNNEKKDESKENFDIQEIENNLKNIIIEKEAIYNKLLYFLENDVDFIDMKKYILEVDDDDNLFIIFQKRVSTAETKEDVLNSIKIYLNLIN